MCSGPSAVKPGRRMNLGCRSRTAHDLLAPMIAHSELKDARSPGEGNQHSATHRRDEERGAQGECPLQPEEPDGDHVLVLDEKHDQHHQDHQADCHRYPQGCGAGGTGVR